MHDPDRVAARAEIDRLCKTIVVSDNTSCGDDFIASIPDAVE